MTKQIRYTGSAPIYESAITGRPTKWRPGQIQDTPDATADALIASGQGFEVYADEFLPLVFDANGAVTGARRDDGTVGGLNSTASFLGAVANQTAMLGLGASPGQSCLRTDTSPRSYWVCVNTPSNQVGNWQKQMGYVGTVASEAAMIAVVPQIAGQFVLRSDRNNRPYFWNGSNAALATNWVASSGFAGTAAGQAAMLALTAVQGDYCIRTDRPASGMWRLKGTSAATLSDWYEVDDNLGVVANEAAMLATTPSRTGQYVQRTDDGNKPYFWNGTDATQAANWVTSGGSRSTFRGVVASQAAMVALSQAVQGDHCLRSDRGGSGVFVLKGSDYSVAANWHEVSDYLGSVASQAAMLTLTPTRAGQFCIRSDQGYANYVWNGSDATQASNWTNWSTLLTALGLGTSYDATTIERLAGLITALPGILNDAAKTYSRRAIVMRDSFTFDGVAITATGSAAASQGTVSTTRTKVAHANGLSAGNVNQYVYVSAWSGTGTPGWYQIGSWASNTDMELIVGTSYDAARGNPTIIGGSATNQATDGAKVATFTIPANSMGKRGSFQASARVRCATTNSRVGRLLTGSTLGGTLISEGSSTTTGTVNFSCEVANLGVETANEASPMVGSSSQTARTIDTTLAQTYSLWYYPGVAAVPFRITSVQVELVPFEA